MSVSVDTVRVLVVEDSPNLLALLEQILGAQGWDVLSASDGDAALLRALEEQPDLTIMDLGLPRRDGLSVLTELRRRGFQWPVLILTARGSVADRVGGLDAGADDYLPKPFASSELVARARALLRRGAIKARADRVRVGDLLLDPVSREVWSADDRLALTQREFALLEFLMRHPNVVLSRQTIAEHVWNDPDLDPDDTNIVDVYVRYVRKKLAAVGAQTMLHTVRGSGYILRTDEQQRTLTG